MSRPGRVSVVVLNFNGGEDTPRCLASLAELDGPASDLEVVVVDNASTDGSVPLVEEALRGLRCRTRLIRNARNAGFAGGCNAGVRRATGEFVAFLNNDARPAPGWLTEAVAVLGREPDVACVASRVLSWDGERSDFDADSGVTFYGFGYRHGFGEEVEAEEVHHERDVLFATGSAMVVRRDVFDAVGGFDERYFAFFEDVDLGWRLWLLGHRVRFVPSSVVYHRHHGTMARYGRWREHYLLERNALYSLVKNLDDDHLQRALPAALVLAVRRGVLHGGDDTGALDLARRAPTGAGLDATEPPEITVQRETVAPLFAIDGLASALPSLLETRRDLQSRRRRSDAEIFGLVRDPLVANLGDDEFVEPHRVLVDLFGLREAFGPRRRVAIVTGDPLTGRMAGPGIRAWEMARVLARHHQVSLATTGACTLTTDEFFVNHVDGMLLRDLVDWCDVLVFQGFLLHDHPWVAASHKALVVDVYDPFHLEQLEQTRGGDPARRALDVGTTVQVLNQQLRRGDFFLCASDRQRDFWLGQLAALGRVNPDTYDDDPRLERLIAVAPFGVPEEPPRRTGPGIRDVVPGIGPDDTVVLWGGGLYRWFDPELVVRAVASAAERRGDLRLFFLGVRHPNPNVPPDPVVARTRALADELGVTGTHVFFNEEWVPYDRRADYLLDADIGVSAHLDHVETAFSFRTRILDYLWAGLPVVTTAGDALGDLVERERLGLTVPVGDQDALAEALLRLAGDADLAAETRANVAAVARRYAWERTLAPLVAYCDRPRRAPDLLSTYGEVDAFLAEQERTDGVRRLARRAAWYLRHEGAMTVARKGVEYARRRRG